MLLRIPGHALGDLHLEFAFSNLVSLQGFAHAIDEMGAAEVIGRDIDRHLQVHALLLPLSKLPAGAIQHPFSQFADQADAFRCIDELVRRHQATFGMAPADQGLDALQLVAVQIHLGLIDEEEFFLLQSSLQVRLETDPPRGALGHLVVVEGIVVLAALLGRIHGCIGSLEQAVVVGAVLGIDGDADAHLRIDAVVVDDNGHIAQLQAALSRGYAIHAALDIPEQDAELVTAETRDEIRLAHRLFQIAGKMTQEHVALLVAHHVVDLLEAVEIDVQQRELGLASARVLDLLLQMLAEMAAVGEPGQLVVIGHVEDLLLRLAKDRDILNHAQKELVAGGFVHPFYDLVHQHPVLPARITLTVLDGHFLAGQARIVDRHLHPAAVIGMDMLQTLVDIQLITGNPAHAAQVRGKLDFRGLHVPLPVADARHLLGDRQQRQVVLLSRLAQGQQFHETAADIAAAFH